MKIISLVLNNFQNDNRVYRMAQSLSSRGHEVRIVGLKKGDVEERERFGEMTVHRIRPASIALPQRFLFFRSITYFEYFIRVILLYRKWDIWHCNDFEAFFIGRIAKLTRPALLLVYDCHEYERERYGLKSYMKFLVNALEPRLIRYAPLIITVGPSIKGEYIRLYGPLNIHLVRNIPHYREPEPSNILRENLQLRSDQRIFLYQGMISGGRGIEVLIDAFSKLADDRNVLVFMGFGKLQSLAIEASKKSKQIFFHPPVSYNLINKYSGSADVGLNTPQNHCLSYYYCLPNKLFEYIQAELPVLTNNLPDCNELVEAEGIGEVIEEFSINGIIEAVLTLTDESLILYRKNFEKIRGKYQWEKEQEKLFEAYSTIGA